MSSSTSQSVNASFLSSVSRAEASSSGTQQSWFDLLPRDLIPGIAGFLSDDCLLSFAGTSTHVFAAVRLALLEGDLQVDSLGTIRWKRALGGTFVSLTDYPNVDGYGSVPQILKEGGWSKGYLRLGEIVRLTLWDSSLKSLTLNWKQDDGGVRSFMDVAFSEGLKELIVRCGCVYTEGIPIYDCSVMSAMDHISNTGIPVESKVEKLELVCDLSLASRYAVLSKFMHLREVTLYRLPVLSDDLATRLLQLDHVHLRALFRNDIPRVLKLGQCVSTSWFRLSSCNFSAADLQSLSVFTTMTSLSVGLQYGAGTGLAALPPTLRELRIRSGHIIGPVNYYDRTLGRVVGLVKQCPNLSVVEVKYSFLKCEDIRDILEATGPRLREFGTSIPFKESGLETLRLIAMMIAVHNRNMRKLEVHMGPQPGGPLRIRPDVRKLAEVYRVPPAIDFLRRRVPKLDAEPLQSAMTYVLHYIDCATRTFD